MGPRALERYDLVSLHLEGIPGAKQMCLVVDYSSDNMKREELQNQPPLAVAHSSRKMSLQYEPAMCVLSDNGADFKNEAASACKSEWQVPRQFSSINRMRVKLTAQHPVGIL